MLQGIQESMYGSVCLKKTPINAVTLYFAYGEDALAVAP